MKVIFLLEIQFNLLIIFNFLFPGDSLHISPLERSYKAKVLKHFPSNVDWNPFDEDAVRMVNDSFLKINII